MVCVVSKLCALVASDIQYNTSFCHLQNFLDDSFIVGYVSNGDEPEYKGLVEDYVQLDISKAKEFVADLQCDITLFVGGITGWHKKNIFKCMKSMAVLSEAYIPTYTALPYILKK